METIEYPLMDTATKTTYHGLQKITASNGEFCFVSRRGEVYQDLKDYIEHKIKWHSYMIGTYKRNCDGLRYHQANLESWQRILKDNTDA